MFVVFANSGLVEVLPENGAVGCGATGAVHHMKGKIYKNWTKHGPCAGGTSIKTRVVVCEFFILTLRA